MPNIRISQVSIFATSQNLRSHSTKDWWNVMRACLAAKASVHLFVEFKERPMFLELLPKVKEKVTVTRRD